MHIPDGFLDARTCVATACLAGTGLAWAGRQTTAQWSDRTIPLLGVMSAFVFAGQMVNFPVLGGTSGHLLGGVLAATLLGPAAAAMALTTVLIVQCLFFQDGGLTALGANVLNLALLGPLSGYAVWRLLGRCEPSRPGFAPALAVAAWVSVVTTAAACAGQIALAGSAPLRLVLPAMLITHAFIGVGEAVITVAVVSFVVKIRPDLLHRPGAQPARPIPATALIGYGLTAAAGIGLLLAPFSSAWPDGLERVAARLGFAEQARAFAPAPMPDYSLGGNFASGWGAAAAALIGIGVAFGLAWAVGRSAARWARARSAGNRPAA